jgi:alpha-1,2-mannosyltransferase
MIRKALVTPDRSREWITSRPVWLAAIIALGAAELWWAVGAHGFYDLRVYQGALRFWRHGGDLYGYVMPPADRYGFTYPPLTAVLLIPLSLLPTRVAAMVTIAATVGATVVVVSLLTGEMPWRTNLRRYQVVGVATLAALALLATRATLAEGQINMYVLALVVVDLLYLRNSRWHGVGVGLATAIKLTPAVFIAYLFVAGQRRAAAVASATFAACGLLGIALAPHESIDFWTRVLWQTNRVGAAGSISNESVRGVLARAAIGHVTAWWLAVVAVLAVVWWRRVRRAAAHGDHVGGLAVTGAFACLASPITWIHHQVFLIPALAVLAGQAFKLHPTEAVGDQRRHALSFWRVVAVLVCVVLAIQVNEIAQHKGGVVMLLVGDAQVWVALGLLLFLPLRGDDRPTGGAGLGTVRSPSRWCCRGHRRSELSRRRAAGR